MKRLLLALTSVAALWTAACSGGGSSVQPPPPTGKYSNASLNGQYAFMTSGEVFTGGFSATPLARAGTFTADGMGNIKGGVEDVNAAGTATNAILITGGSYTVNADGRGTLTLLLGPNTLQFGIALTSVDDGLMIDETFVSTQSSQASTGSGNFIKQNSASFAVSAVAGPYVFDFSGLDGKQSPESFIGQFTATNSNGVVNAAGIFDDNDNATLANGSFTGTFTEDSLNTQASMASFGRGIAQIANQNFVFYIVDSTRIRFVSTSGGTISGMLSGDAVAQTTLPATLNSGFAFVVAGASGTGGLVRVGRLTVNTAAASPLPNTTNVVMDSNDTGKFHLTGGNGGNSVTSASISSFDPSTGRGTLTFQDTSLQLAFQFVFYLSSATQGVIQETTQNAQGFAAVVADGSILAQSGSPFTGSNFTGPYAFNWSGLSNQQNGQFIDEEDLLAQANLSSLALSGTADIFQFTAGVPVINLGVGGSITVGGDGTGSDGNRSTMTVNLTGASPINFVVYFVNPQLAFFANNTNSGTTRIVVGVMKAQQ